MFLNKTELQQNIFLNFADLNFVVNILGALRVKRNYPNSILKSSVLNYSISYHFSDKQFVSFFVQFCLSCGCPSTCPLDKGDKF